MNQQLPSRPDDASLFLGNQLCFALYAASLAMTKTYRPLLEPLGLTFPQYVVMMALWEHRELTAGALARTVALDAGTLVPVVRKLVAQGLVVRQRRADDDRSVTISLTPAGLALQQQAFVGLHATHFQHVGLRRQLAHHVAQGVEQEMPELAVRHQQHADGHQVSSRCLTITCSNFSRNRVPRASTK